MYRIEDNVSQYVQETSRRILFCDVKYLFINQGIKKSQFNIPNPLNSSNSLKF